MTESILVYNFVKKNTLYFNNHLIFIKQNFVDLAGSEKISIHDPMRKRKRDSSAGPSVG